MKPQAKLIVSHLVLAGFSVYMRDPDKDEYALFTDGNRIGYIQWSKPGITMSTVHRPNRTTGTGFAVGEPGKMTRENFERAFATAPNWIRGTDLNSVKKWRDWEEFANANDFNREYKLIEIGNHEG